VLEQRAGNKEQGEEREHGDKRIKDKKIKDKRGKGKATRGTENLRLFQVYCNKTTNKTLQAIGKRYDIGRHLTCHVARHTFATVSLQLGIPIEVVSKLLGHTNLRTTQISAKIVDEVKVREMEKWNSGIVVSG
jgi:integrase